tara:strand:- start:7793 stop:8089 length:297 start_codon:yes stop_codon:yes gene_type:complete
MSDVYTSVLERDGHRCFICGKTKYLQMHHVIPKSSGGETIKENCIMLCGPTTDPGACHWKVHYSGEDRYAKYLCSGRKNNKKFLIELSRREKRANFSI